MLRSGTETNLQLDGIWGDGLAKIRTHLDKHKNDLENAGAAGKKAIKGVISALEKEVADFGLSADTVKLYELAHLGASKAVQAHASALVFFHGLLKKADESYKSATKAVQDWNATLAKAPKINPMGDIVS